MSILTDALDTLSPSAPQNVMGPAFSSAAHHVEDPGPQSQYTPDPAHGYEMKAGL